MIKEIPLKTHSRCEMIDITSVIEPLVKDIDEGVATIFVKHTTAGVTINENADPDVKRDILWKLEGLFPKHDGYNHAEGNSDAHIKSSLIGSSVSVIVRGGRLLLGSWQGIFFCEFDGPRNRKIIIKA